MAKTTSLRIDIDTMRVELENNAVGDKCSIITLARQMSEPVEYARDLAELIFYIQTFVPKIELTYGDKQKIQYVQFKGLAPYFANTLPKDELYLMQLYFSGLKNPKDVIAEATSPVSADEILAMIHPWAMYNALVPETVSLQKVGLEKAMKILSERQNIKNALIDPSERFKDGVDALKAKEAKKQ